MPIRALIVITVIGFMQTAPVINFIPTSEIVRVASMAAKDEGYHPDVDGTYLQELRTADGKEPKAGYNSIALYRNGHSVRSYSIRINTGDVVDPNSCEIFRFPDLVEFKSKLMKGFGSEDVSFADIADEVGCERLIIVSQRKRKDR